MCMSGLYLTISLHLNAGLNWNKKSISYNTPLSHRGEIKVKVDPTVRCHITQLLVLK